MDDWDNGRICRVRTDRRAVALTFDDGPDPEYTPQVLDVLERHGAKGTFFMLGQRAGKYPHLIRRVAESGHAIGVHSWDHSDFATIGQIQRMEQISRCERVLSPFAERLFRPPYGRLTIEAHIDCRKLGYKVILWSSLVYDWQRHDASWTARRLSEGLLPGGIILMHDHLWRHGEPEEMHPVLSALDYVLARAKDYSFVSVPELLSQTERYNDK